MRLLFALTGSVATFLVVATLTGHADTLRVTLPGQRRQRTTREAWLRQAGVPVTPAQFWGVSALVALAVEFVCWGLAGSAVVGMVPALTAGLGPSAYYGRRRTVHLSAVVEAWPQADRDLLSSIQSHQSIHQGLLELAETGPLPMRQAFANYATLARLSGPEAALAIIREELADPVSDRMIELLMVAYTEGEDLTIQVLRDQAGQLTEDLRTTAEIRALQHEPRLVARGAFVAPWLVLVMICSGVPAYRDFYRTGGGVTAVVVAGLLSCGGLLVMRRMVKEPAEPRVLGLAAAR